MRCGAPTRRSGVRSRISTRLRSRCQSGLRRGRSRGSNMDTSSSPGTHGTYLAGVIGPAANNGIGNVGDCPGCRVMPVQIGTDSGAYLSDMASGIIWATDHGARVENLSWEGSSTSSALTAAVAYARSKGVVVVAAAGNSNCNCVTYPASTPGVLGVAAPTSPTTSRRLELRLLGGGGRPRKQHDRLLRRTTAGALSSPRGLLSSSRWGRLDRERHLVVDRVEGVLRHYLSHLHVEVPRRASRR
jgi:subtilisin family serine protease